jgi:hypothetical protein
MPIPAAVSAASTRRLRITSFVAASAAGLPDDDLVDLEVLGVDPVDVVVVEFRPVQDLVRLAHALVKEPLHAADPHGHDRDRRRSGQSRGLGLRDA